MAFSGQLLMYGHDAMLLNTRRWVLEREGYHVRTTTKFTEAELAMDEVHVDLLIVCHTVPAAECDRLLGKANAVDMTMRHLLLGSERPVCADCVGDTVLQEFANPGRLMEAVRLAIFREQGVAAYA